MLQTLLWTLTGILSFTRLKPMVFIWCLSQMDSVSISQRLRRVYVTQDERSACLLKHKHKHKLKVESRCLCVTQTFLQSALLQIPKFTGICWEIFFCVLNRFAETKVVKSCPQFDWFIKLTESRFLISCGCFDFTEVQAWLHTLTNIILNVKTHTHTVTGKVSITDLRETF